jgi:hypothetical protein
MAITRLSLSKENASHKTPPPGMHSSFTVRKEVPTTELFMRLYQLRALLRITPDEPLVAAPSILAVLMKLLSLSSSMSAAFLSYNDAVTAGNPQRPETPPMLSEALRHLWVDCVALCHVQGERLTGGAAQMQTTPFLRQMLALVATNPRSLKAAGGVRVAALQAVRALFAHLPARMAPWALDVLQVCQKALRSAGNGEPSYRAAAMEAASATAVACRQALLQRTTGPPPYPLVLAGAMEEKALQEIGRILKQATSDKFPEVRRGAALLASVAAPLSLSSSAQPAEALAALDEWLPICLRNLDDVSAFVSQAWAQALARILCTVLEYHSSRGINPGGGGGGGEEADIGESRSAPFSAPPKSLLSQMRTVGAVLTYMAQQFARAGGELGAARLGGPLSTGGRGVRVGWTLALVEVLRLVGTVQGIEVNPKAWRAQLLRQLLSTELEKQLRPPEYPASTNTLFATAAQRNWSKADAPLVRTLVGRVFRQGLVEGANEPTQLGLLDDFVTALEQHKQSPPVGDEKKASATENANSKHLTSNQLQVALGEISHLIATLGEAMSSKVDEILVAVRQLLSHADTGVRFESAVALTALVNYYPAVGTKIFPELISEIQGHHAELLTMASSGESKSDEPQPKQTSGLRMFRKKEKQVDASAPHQQAIHGKAVFMSLLLRDMPQTEDGLPKSMVASVIPVTEILVSSQFSDILTKAFPAAACVCVRAGYALISGIMTTGPKTVAPHVSLIFGAWNKSQQATKAGGKHLVPRHDLFCTDALLVSVVVFLKYCSELLLSVPEALTQVSIILEELLPLLVTNGRLGSIPLTPPVAAKLESARASLLEAFAWLPSGSFPMAADSVFSFAAQQIKVAIDSDVSCSILEELVDEEDSLLDVKTVGRATKEAHSAGACDLAMSLIALRCEPVHPAEQESVMHLISRPVFGKLGEGSAFQESHILGLCAKRTITEKPPTPLHEVGAWRRPIDPCCSSRVRLIDAAIQAFSATFGLKSGKEQQSAMDMLESLVPPYFAQLARAVGVNASLTEQERRAKSKEEDSAAMTNITAVLLSCLQSLPLHESTHNIPVSLGPPWMNKAKNLLLTLLPSASNDIRRAAAEGLALLATLGVSEDAHFLQSKVLHSLDEVMQGNKPDGKVLRALPLESVAAARAGALLTLACIQRTASNITERHLERARIRSGSPNSPMRRKKSDDLPVFQMMTRILPSINYFGFRDYFVVRSYAIHAFAVLLAYSERLESETLGPVEIQLLEKAIELVEDNFCSSWMAASSDVDRGEEPEKMAAEACLLSVLLRLMVFLAKHLRKLESNAIGLIRRFSFIAQIILEKHRLHPYVVREVMALMEVLAPVLASSAAQAGAVGQQESVRDIFSCATTGFYERSPLYSRTVWDEPSLLSFGSARASFFAELSLALTKSSEATANFDHAALAGRCLALLERASGSQYFDGARMFRFLAASTRAERRFFESSTIREEAPKLLLSLVASDSCDDDCCLRWILLSRAVLSGPRAVSGEASEAITHYTIENVATKALDQSESDVAVVFAAGNPPRTDVKATAAQMLALSLGKLLTNHKSRDGGLDKSDQFSYFEAKKTCQKLLKVSRDTDSALPCSRLVFHLQELVTTVCMSTSASLDHSELYSVQEPSAYVLAKVIQCFSRMEDPEVPDTRLLEQYAQQIFSSVKHAVSSADENSSERAIRVFHAGCDALCSIVEEELSTEVAVLKRLMRSIVTPLSDVQFVPFYDGKSLLATGKVSLSDIKLVCQVAAVGQFFFKFDAEASLEHVLQARKDILKTEVGLSTHFALVAMEGARLLAANNLTLVGRSALEKGATVGPEEGGIFFDNDCDMSEIAKSITIRSWSSCCRSAIHALTELSTSDSEADETKNIEAWTEAMACLAIEGAEDGLTVLHDSESYGGFGLDMLEIVSECLSGVVVLVKRKGALVMRMKSKLEHLLGSLCEKVVVPCLDGSLAVADLRAVETTCKLLQAVAEANLRISQAAVVTALLTPLQYLEDGKIKSENHSACLLLKAALTGVASVISHADTQASFVKSVLALVLKHVFHVTPVFPDFIMEASKALLVECFRHKTTTRVERSRLAAQLVETNEWGVWAVAFTADGGSATSGSLDKVSAELVDESSRQQLKALAAVLTVAQSSPPPSETIVRLMHGVGSSVMQVIYMYGTGKASDTTKAQEACAGAMKVLLISFMQLTSSGVAESEFAEFLNAIFGVFLAVIRYNGLPNHPSRQPEGDANLGRLCTQAILHIARTAPAAFKSCVASLAPHDRALLEFAVRGEMTGYQVQGGGQEKKKLNLKSFKK